MTDRNRSELDREQRGSSNPNQSERPEDRSTRSGEGNLDNISDTNRGQGGSERGIGSEPDDRGQGNVGSSREDGSRSTGNMEGKQDRDF
ncbi:MAG: hypothetical protein M3R55_14980 [Acidobacteriota bacterium]|nr:hypothetical protein [Acidobacteriota bacterium]